MYVADITAHDNTGIECSEPRHIASLSEGDADSLMLKLQWACTAFMKKGGLKGWNLRVTFRQEDLAKPVAARCLVCGSELKLEPKQWTGEQRFLPCVVCTRNKEILDNVRDFWKHIEAGAESAGED